MDKKEKNKIINMPQEEIDRVLRATVDHATYIKIKDVDKIQKVSFYLDPSYSLGKYGCLYYYILTKENIELVGKELDKDLDYIGFPFCPIAYEDIEAAWVDYPEDYKK